MFEGQKIKRAAWGLAAAYLISASATQTAAQTYKFPIPESRALTGTFGELRETHLHFGLDIRTFGRTGLPVRAAADGYVSRVRVWYNGYGKALYLKHPNGQTTVYAHLERFAPALDTFIYRKQMAARQFNQDLFFFPHEFPFKQGEIMAYSGNTGGSAGPHLHYEIRDAAERILNPIAYHRDELEDYLPPFITRVAFEPLEINARINGKFDKYVEFPKNSEKYYFSEKIIRVKGKVGFEFTGYDKLVGAVNYNGLYSANLYLDDTLIYAFKMDRFSFDESGYIKQHVDYGFMMEHNGATLQKCYLDRNNGLPVYHSLKNNGVIELKDARVHSLRLEARDFHGNFATFQGKIQQEADEKSSVTPANGGKKNVRPSFSVKRGALVVKTAPDVSSVTLVYPNGVRKESATAYLEGETAVTLSKLDKGAPTPVYALCGKDTLTLPFVQALSPGRENTAAREGKWRAYFGPSALFDDVFLTVTETKSDNPMYCSPIYTIGDYRMPLLVPFALRLFPNEKADKFGREKLALIEIKTDGSYNRFGTDSNGATLAKRFGRYVLIADTTAPTLAPLNFSPAKKIPRSLKRLDFKLADAVSEVNPWRVTVTWDGAWTVPEYYDYQNLLQVYFPQKPGPHTLVVTAYDHSGNRLEKRYDLVLE